jgi:hypothetical protein
MLYAKYSCTSPGSLASDFNPTLIDNEKEKEKKRNGLPKYIKIQNDTTGSVHHSISAERVKKGKKNPSAFCRFLFLPF